MPDSRAVNAASVRCEQPATLRVVRGEVQSKSDSRAVNAASVIKGRSETSSALVAVLPGVDLAAPSALSVLIDNAILRTFPTQPKPTTKRRRSSCIQCARKPC